MMEDVQDLYQELILDHNKRPRNRRELEGADRKAEGYNPLCGDHVPVFVNVGSDRVQELTVGGPGRAVWPATRADRPGRGRGEERR